MIKKIKEEVEAFGVKAAYATADVSAIEEVGKAVETLKGPVT